jgi:hypothetical protein
MVPEEGVIGGLSFKSLYVDIGNGHRFIPTSLKESNCALDRMLGRRVGDAIRAGAIAYTRMGRGEKSEEQFERFSMSINSELNKLFVPLGMTPNTGLSEIRSLIQDAFDIPQFSMKIKSPLQKLAYDARVYTPNLILNWLIIEYVKHLGVSGFDSEKLVEGLRSLDASYNPPSTLRVPDCSEQLAYRWPTISVPISTYKGIGDYENVHWAICRSSGDVWVYYYRGGWKKAQPTEKAQACEDFGDEEPFRSFCAR